MQSSNLEVANLLRALSRRLNTMNDEINSINTLTFSRHSGRSLISGNKSGRAELDSELCYYHQRLKVQGNIHILHVFKLVRLKTDYQANPREFSDTDYIFTIKNSNSNRLRLRDSSNSY